MFGSVSSACSGVMPPKCGNANLSSKGLAINTFDVLSGAGCYHKGQHVELIGERQVSRSKCGE